MNGQEADGTRGVVEQAPQVVDEILGVLAERFGATGAHLWEVMVRQAVVDAVAFSVGFGLYTLVWIGATADAVWWARTTEDDEMGAASLVMFAVGGVTWLIVMAAGLPGVVTALMNPEHRALTEVLRLVQ